MRVDYTKRTDPGPFRAVWRGDKRAEIRKEDDCQYEVRDRVLLIEFDRNIGKTLSPHRDIVIEITHILRGFDGLKDGWVSASFKVLRRKVHKY